MREALLLGVCSWKDRRNTADRRDMGGQYIEVMVLKKILRKKGFVGKRDMGQLLYCEETDRI